MSLPDFAAAEELDITFPMGRWTYTRKTWPSNDGRPVFEESPQRNLESRNGKWELNNYFQFDEILGSWKRIRDNEPEDIKIVVTRFKGADDKGKSKHSLGEILLTRLGEDTKDVTITIDGREVMKAHRSILSATCPAWRDLLTSGMSDGKRGQIDLYHVKPIVLKSFVKCLYTQDSPKEAALFAPVAMMCDQYRCSSLMEKCVTALEHAMKSDVKLLRRTVKHVFTLESSTPIAHAMQGAIHGALCHRMPPKEIFCDMFFSMRHEDEYKNQGLTGL